MRNIYQKEKLYSFGQYIRVSKYILEWVLISPMYESEICSLTLREDRLGVSENTRT